MTGKAPTGKLFIKTHGCQMNEYDSDKMLDVLAAEHGLELTLIEADADVILINTCSIREKAQEKVFSQLGRWRELKAKNPKLIAKIDMGAVTEAYDACVRHLTTIDPVGRRHDTFSEMVRFVGGGILLLTIGIIAVLVWRGFL